MDTRMLSSLARLSDVEILGRVKLLVQREREATVTLAAHLAVLDERRLYLAEGCSSLFTYCTQVLRLSEHAAYGRIETARAARKFPILLQMVAGGAVTLTTVGLLAPHLTPKNHRELLDRARHKSKRQVEELVVQLHPHPPVPASVRRLPTTIRGLAQTTVLLEAATGSPAPGVGSDAESQPLPTWSPTSPAARPAIVAPLAPGRYRVQFTANAGTHQKLQLAQNLLRHQVPDGDLGEIFDRALTALLEDLAKKKLAATDRPRESRSVPSDSRCIPAEVRRVVWLRDEGRCAFVSRKGRRCTAQAFLEFHHIVPYGTGGDSTADNIQLRCRPHNAHEAEMYFGQRASAVREEPAEYLSAPERRTLRSLIGMSPETRSGPSP